MKKISPYLMTFVYVAAGFNHFRDPGFYLRMMPPWIPEHALMVQLSGLAEIFLGLALLWPRFRRLAAWGVILLLLAVFPANLFMFQEREGLFHSIPAWILLLRLPAQVLLIWWAYSLARRPVVVPGHE